MSKKSVKEASNQLWSSFKFPAIFVAILWLVRIAEKVTETMINFDFNWLGVYPRKIAGLKGILFYPLIHGDFQHLFSNSVPLLVLGFLLFQSYRKVAWQTFAFIYFVSGIMVWALANPAGNASFHIGASGLVYGLAFFVFFSGIFRRDIRSIALALLVAFLYGGIIWGVLPIYEGVSWEGHLFGAIAGTFCAWRYREINKIEKKEWKEDSEPKEIVEDPFWVNKPPVVEESPAAPAPPPATESSLDADLEALKNKYKDGLY